MTASSHVEDRLRNRAIKSPALREAQSSGGHRPSVHEDPQRVKWSQTSESSKSTGETGTLISRTSMLMREARPSHLKSPIEGVTLIPCLKSWKGQVHGTALPFSG